MFIASSHKEISTFLAQAKQAGKHVGFVPTMGALHAGHLSLIDRCLEDSEVCVCSIFVNPTQFNNANDLATYPRTVEQDAKLLEERGCHVAFVPGVSDIYPNGPEVKTYDLAGLDSMMEGAFRPGHFDGMATVVARLFQLVEPDNAYFGEKDYQQLLLIKQLVRAEKLPVSVIGCPIVREANGLAMSSRNQRLTATQREQASFIHDELMRMRASFEESTPETLKASVQEAFTHSPLELEYVEIAHADTLQPLATFERSTPARVFIAAYLGGVRLIDNAALN